MAPILSICKCCCVDGQIFLGFQAGRRSRFVDSAHACVVGIVYMGCSSK